MNRLINFSIAAGIVVLFASGCNNPFSYEKKEKRQIDTTYNPVINPDNFVARIDNNYYPLNPGTKYTYRIQTEDGVERNEVQVTRQTKTILGVTCTVIADSVWLNDGLIEATLDWYAQDKAGNVWYFGEDSKQFENGRQVGNEGSWEAGVNTAKPGIIMEANPKVGDSYRQEYLFNIAEDMGEVLSLGETVTLTNGTSYTGCLKTKDFTPLETDVVENKYYSPGVGVVLELTVKGDSERGELISVTTE